MTWLPMLLQSATSRGSGVFPETWQHVATRSPLEVPPEVRAFWEAADGARFPGEVRLWSWLEVEEHSARGLGSMPPQEVWLLGTKRETGIFFVTRAATLKRAVPLDVRPPWLETLDPQAFVYGLWRAAGDLLVVRSLRELLMGNIPRPGDDFGEVTFARAMVAVKDALASLEPPKKKPAGKPKPKPKPAVPSKKKRR